MTTIVVILVAAALIVLWGVSAYNRFVTRNEKIENTWGQVENQYQRRSDLIPNLVATVKGYATHEEKTLTEVVDARAKATQITVDPKNLTPEALAAYQAAQGDITSALGRLMAVREAYPDLKANQNFIELQAQLEGTENRITVARKDFNDAVREYNVAVRRFPSNIIAKMFDFGAKPYFEAKEGAETAPVVEF